MLIGAPNECVFTSHRVRRLPRLRAAMPASCDRSSTRFWIDLRSDGVFGTQPVLPARKEFTVEPTAIGPRASGPIAAPPYFLFEPTVLIMPSKYKVP